MTMIDRYVAAVGEQLHPSRRDAVEAELRANILDALEARGGSSHNEEDVVAVLEQLGSPARMAAEYEPDRGLLVGRQWLPHMRRTAAYLFAAVLTCGALFYGVGLLLGGLIEFRAGTLLATTLSVMLRAVIGGAVVFVGVFAWLQRSAVHPPPVPAAQEWDPRSFARRPPGRRTARFDSAIALVALTVVMLVLDGVGRTARDVAPQIAAPLQPLAGDVVFAVYALQVAIILSFAAHVGLMVKGRRMPWASVLRSAADAVAVVVFTTVAFRLVPYRAALVEAGASHTFIDLLIANAFVVAVVIAVLVVVTWRSEWRGALSKKPTPRSTIGT